jgi:hypothetical protein
VKTSTTKTRNTRTKIDQSDPTNEIETPLDGTTVMSPILESPTTSLPTMKLTDKIKLLFPKAQTTRVIIDNLTKDNYWLLQWLWDNHYQLIVASDDYSLLNLTNSKIINLSGSLGRWRVVSYAQSLIEPSDCFIMYKELENDQTLRMPSKQILTASEYQAC